jgi:hypothetical protein
MAAATADSHLKTAGSTQTSLHYTATMARSVAASFRAKYLQPEGQAPALQLTDVLCVEVAVAKVRSHLNDAKVPAGLETAISLLPEVLAVLSHVASSVRLGLLSCVEEPNAWLADLLAVAASHNAHTANLTLGLRALLPTPVRAALERWNGAKPNYAPASVKIPKQFIARFLIKINLAFILLDLIMML